MYFKLNLKCTHIQDGTPLRIYSLQARQISPDSPLVELGIAFLYNPEKKLFGIYQLALLQGKSESIYTLIAHCAANEEVEFILSAAKDKGRLNGLLRFKNSTERQFAMGYYTQASTPVKLVSMPADQRSVNGPKATVYAGVKGKFMIPLTTDETAAPVVKTNPTE